MGGVDIKNKPMFIPKVPLVAIDQLFIYQKTTDLLLKEKLSSFSGDDFDIKDINGVSFFKCKGKAFSLREKKVFYDQNNQPLFNIKHDLLSLRGRYKIFRGEGNELIVKVDPLNSFSHTKYGVSFKNLSNGKNEYIELRCDEDNCGIFYGKGKKAPIICKIFKKFDAKYFFTDKQNYKVHIAPNIDAALMIALGVCFDEIKNDEKD